MKKLIIVHVLLEIMTLFQVDLQYFTGDQYFIFYSLRCPLPIWTENSAKQNNIDLSSENFDK